MTLDMSKYAPALKQYYSTMRVENMVYKDHPFMAMVKKDEKFFGENSPVPLIYGNPQGRSAVFATAKANKGSSQLGKFTLTRSKDYSLASIDAETAEASENDSGAFLKAMTVEIDGALQSATNSLASSLYTDSSGWVGQVGAFTATTITLNDPEMVVYFEIGMVVQIAQLKSTGGFRDAGATITVTGVDRDAGILTFVAVTAVITAIANNDYIFFTTHFSYNPHRIFLRTTLILKLY